MARQPKGPTVPWGASGQVREGIVPVLHGLTSSTVCSFGCHSIKKDIKLLESIQRRATKMGKSLEALMTATAPHREQRGSAELCSL